MNNYGLLIVNFVLLIIRTYLAIYGIETTPLTLLINAILLYILCDGRSKLSVLLLVLMAVIVAIFNRNALALLDILLFAYLIRNLNVFKLFKIYLRFLLFILFVILLFNYLGIVSSHETFINYKGDEATIYAGDLGMSNPNAAGQFFYVLCCVIAVICGNVRNLYKILICLGLFGVSYIVYNYTYCRTAFFSTCIMLFFYLFLPMIKKIGKINRAIMAFTPILMALLAFYITKNYSQFDFLNAIATNRFSYPGQLMQQMTPINWLFGINVPDAVDTSYMLILFSGGIFSFIVIFYLFMRNIWKYYETIVPLEPFIMSVFAFGVTENVFSSCNPVSVMLFSILLFPRHLVYSKKTKI